jgi:hypothetical protein
MTTTMTATTMTATAADDLPGRLARAEDAVVRLQAAL